MNQKFCRFDGILCTNLDIRAEILLQQELSHRSAREHGNEVKCSAFLFTDCRCQPVHDQAQALSPSIPPSSTRRPLSMGTESSFTLDGSSCPLAAALLQIYAGASQCRDVAVESNLFLGPVLPPVWFALLGLSIWQI